MNRRQAQALLWDQYARTWPFFLAGFVISILAGYSAKTFAARYLSPAEAPPYLQFFALLVLGLGLLYSLSAEGRLDCGVPASAFLLPVPTSALILTRIAFGAAAMIGLSALVFVAQSLLFQTPASPWWVYATLAASIYALLQLGAIMSAPLGDWSLGVLITLLLLCARYPIDRFNLGRLPFHAVGVLTGTTLAGWLIVHLQRHGTWRLPQIAPSRLRSDASRSRRLSPRHWLASPSLPSVFIGSLSLMIIAWWFGEYSVVDLALLRDLPSPESPGQREMVWKFLWEEGVPYYIVSAVALLSIPAAFLTWFVAEIKASSALANETMPFLSAKNAQRWFDAIRLQKLSVAIYGAVFAGWVLPRVVSSWNYVQFESDASIGFLVEACAVASLIVGVAFLFLNYRLHAGAMRGFLFLRPLSSRDISTQRLLTTVRILVRPLALFSYAAFVCIALDARDHSDAPYYLFFRCLQDLGMLVTLSWVAIWAVNAAATLLATTLASALREVVASRSNEVSQDSLWNVGTGLLVVVVAILLLIAHRRRLLSSRLLFAAIAILASPFLLAFFLLGYFPNANSTMQVLPFYALSIAPIATVPLVIHWSRHR